MVIGILLQFSFNLSFGAPPQAIGFYSKGALERASTLQSQNEYYYQLHPSRNRAWSTDLLNEAISTVSRKMKGLYPEAERLGVGDTSARDGGYLSGHGSHQNGLDADLTYFRLSGGERGQDHEGFSEEFVVDGKLTDNFDVEKNWAVLAAFVGGNKSNWKVGRIFVDPIIKKVFCHRSEFLGTLEQDTEVLRRLRPWPHHANHFHLRLECPVTSPACEAQTPPDPGSGCDSIDQMWVMEVGP